MAVDGMPGVALHHPARTRHRTTAVLLVAGGLLLAVGGQLHPRGSGNTVEAHLLSMLASPQWAFAHLISLAGLVVVTVAFAGAWRSGAFGPSARPWVLLAALGWGFGALEQVPHLLAAGDAHALAHHEPTPVLDLHVMLQIVATPAVGLSGAAVAVAAARSAGSRAAWVLAAVALLGGLLYAASAPLVALTEDTAAALLFPFQAALALWLVGTGVGLWRT